MAFGGRNQKSSGGASSATQRWVAWREEARAAAAEDRKRAIDARAERDRQIEREYHNPVAFWVGLVVLLVLLVGGWFLLDAMRCDPFYSDIGLSRSRACR
jgi:uncharacterized membrane protein